jgi:hypothetical protein
MGYMRTASYTGTEVTERAFGSIVELVLLRAFLPVPVKRNSRHQNN